jgi:hypothetical protein
MNKNEIVGKLVEIANSIDFLNKQLHDQLSELIFNIKPEEVLPKSIPVSLIEHIREEFNNATHSKLIAGYSLEMDWENRVSIESLDLDVDEIEVMIERAYDEMITKIEIMNSDESQE